MYIRRELQDSIQLERKKPLAIVLLGARRTGKTTLLKKITENRTDCRWFDGDNPGDAVSINRLFKENGLPALLSSFKTVVIDEAQAIPGIGSILKVMVDINQETNILVTGSSALHLAGGVLESAIGRLYTRELWPFSLTELAQHFGWDHLHHNISTYLTYGLMPTCFDPETNPRKFLYEYCNDLLFKDIFRLSLLKKPSSLVHLLQVLASSIGSEVNYDSLSRETGLNKGTVATYIDLLEQCFIIRKCDSFSKNLTNELKKGKKIYFVDVGVRNAVLKDFRPFPAREDAGALWENFFFMERLKLHSYAEDFKEIYFWRTRTGTGKRCEIDFVEVLDRQPIAAFECKLSPGAAVKAEEDFLKSYPGCKVSIANPLNFEAFFRNDDQS